MTWMGWVTLFLLIEAIAGAILLAFCAIIPKDEDTGFADLPVRWRISSSDSITGFDAAPGASPALGIEAGGRRRRAP